MSYAHFWYRQKELDKDKFKQFITLSKKILKEAKPSLGVHICGPLGKGVPKINKDSISFNGLELLDLNYETFSIDRIFKPTPYHESKKLDNKDYWLCFCSTNRKPYDAIVCSILIAFKYCFQNEIILRSDGNWKNWEAGLFIFKKVTGEEITNPFQDKYAEGDFGI